MVPRRDRRDPVAFFTDTAWDVALAVVVQPPAANRSIFKEGDGVFDARRDRRDPVAIFTDAAWDVALTCPVVPPTLNIPIPTRLHNNRATNKRKHEPFPQCLSHLRLHS